MRFKFFVLFLLFPFCAKSQYVTANTVIVDSLITAYEPFLAITLIDKILRVSKDPLEKKELEIDKNRAFTIANMYGESVANSENLLKKYKTDIFTLRRVRLHLALTYEKLGNYSNCKEELDKIYQYNKSLPEDRFYAIYLYRKSSYFRQIGEYELALFYAKECFYFSDHHSFLDEKAVSSFLWAFLTENNPKQQIYLLNNSLKEWKSNKDEHGTASMYLALAKIYFQLNENDKALKYCDSSLFELNNKAFLSGSIASTYQLKSSIFEKLRKYDSALVSYKKFSDFNELDESRKSRIEQTKQEYELLLLTKRLKLYKAIRDAEGIRKQVKFLSILLWVALLSLVIIMFLGYRIMRGRKKINKQRELLRSQNLDLKGHVMMRETLMKELQHRTKNNLSFILALIDLQIDNKEKVDSQVQLEELKGRIMVLSEAHDLLIGVLDPSLKSDSIYLKPFLQSLFDNMRQLSTLKTELNLDLSDILLPADICIPIGLLMNELCTNSLKHAKLEGVSALELSVRNDIVGNRFYLYYKDNGVLENKSDFNPSLGMFIIKSMVKQLKGEFKRSGNQYEFEFDLVKNK